MGCDSQFDGLYEGQRRLEAQYAARKQAALARGYVAQSTQGYGPYEHKVCATVTTDMDVHDRNCEAGKVEPDTYVPRHRA